LRNLPFATGSFGAVVCVGEVLGYCDPVKVLTEFARILEPGGRLIVDFGNTGSLRHIFTPSYRRAADLVVVEYNGSPERIWNYDPSYIESVLQSLQFKPAKRHGFYGWSVLLNRLGLASRASVAAERLLSQVPFSSRWSDLIMLVCDRA
jgi:SAM-dependent methyltransferase